MIRRRLRGLASDLDRVCAHARELGDCLAGDLADASSRARARARARELTSDLADQLDRVHADALDLDFITVRLHEVTGHLDRAVDRATELIGRDLRDIHRNPNTGAAARSRTRALIRALDLARGSVLPGGGTGGHDRAGSGARLLARTAARLLAGAARLLPTGDRARYAEEFSSELRELAQAGASGRRQAAYGLRQLRAALALRGELLAPRRRKAGP